ncbi:MAG: RNA-binding protein [Deltaproteobacteria bacterium]|nr:MAG: RNA-binding protein [Deltaproteobacteria bacterium]
MADPVVLSGEFQTPEDARHALEALNDMHLPTRDLHVRAVTPQGVTPLAIEHRVRPFAGGAAGIAIGAVAGLLAATFAALGTPYGMFEASTFTALFGGTVVGAGAGLIGGLLGGLGYAEHVAALEEHPHADFLIGARVPRALVPRVRTALWAAGAQNVHQRASHHTATA